MGSQTQIFLEHLSWSLVGITVNSGIIFAMNIFAGRLLGPEEYGKYNLVLTLSYILSVFMIFGQDTVFIRRLARDPSKKNTYLASSFFLTVVSCLFLGILSFVFAKYISFIFKTEELLWCMAVVYALFFSFKSVVDGFFRGLHFFKKQAVARMIETGVTILAFAGVFFFWTYPTYVEYVLVLVSGFVCFPFLFFATCLTKKGRVEIQCNKEDFMYALGMTWLSLLSILSLSADKLFIGRYVGMEGLGMYSAYVTSSILLVTQISNIFSNVFFPLIQVKKKMKSIVKKVDAFSLAFFVPGAVFLSLASGFIFHLFGERYVLSWVYIVLFSFSGMLQFFGGFYRNIAMVEIQSFRTMQRLTFLGLVFFFVFLSLSVFLGGDVFKNIVYSYALYSLLSFFLMRRSCRCFF